ncbi:MAG: SH3 domain-containing protein [Oscillospiraceae bacterium]|nr:SH3 domain-containing protein [Oscillospiraceae bacterium]
MIDTGLEPGGTLIECLAGMTADEAVKMGRELCAQLPGEPEGFHGGVWPGNIQLDWEGKAVLGAPDHSAAAGRTADQVEYVAPEYFWDNIAAAAADVYAVALLVYAGCNGGRLPFQPAEGLTEKDRSDALRRRMKGEPVPRPQGVSDQLWGVLEKALSYEAESRYLTARELLSALGDTDEALPVPEAAVSAAAIAAAAAEAQAQTDVPAEEPVSEEAAPAEDAAPAETEPAEEPAPEAEQAPEADAAAQEETALEESAQGESVQAEEPAPEEAAEEPAAPKDGEPAPDGETTPEGDVNWTEEPAELSQETGGLSAQEEQTAKRQYTVQKDFEKTRHARREPSMAPAAQRKKKKGVLGLVLPVLGAAVLLIVVLALIFGGNGDIQETSENFAVSPATAEPTATPITITPAPTAAATASPAPTEDADEDTEETETDDEGTLTAATATPGTGSGTGTSSSSGSSSGSNTSTGSSSGTGTGSSSSSSSSSYTVTEVSDTVYVTYSVTNVRNGPGTSYSILGTVTAGTSLTRTGISGGWSRVSYNGQTGFISTSLLSTTAPTATAAATATAAPTETPVATAAATPTPTAAPTATPAATVTSAPSAAYTITVSSLGWEDAKAEAESAGETLAVLSDDSDFEGLTGQLDTVGASYAWLGAVKEDDTWYWEQDGEKTAFSETDAANWGDDTDGEWLLLAKIDGDWQYIAVSAED